MSEWLEGLRRKQVVFTGDSRQSIGLRRDELADLVREAGGRVSKEVTQSTDVLVRGGYSPNWKYGDYGIREAEVAELQRRGFDAVIIDDHGLLQLLHGFPAQILKPHRPPPRPVFMAPYRSALDQAVTTRRASAPDPEAWERALMGHRQTQEALADAVRSAGYEPRSPARSDCDFDLAWTVDGVVIVAEVKSLTGENERSQLRVGLGQVLDYAHRLSSSGQVVAVLAAEAQPSDPAWETICSRASVDLCWPETFPKVVGAISRRVRRSIR